ncbi:hypothetical protein HIM_05084 [Hirsutella minnesotensis 3608]|uniref:DUF6590 domain-containing protein n=1 Tax=Hirsutella minnesotensis 3608 TaxID=1043627 RepID=A0A0F7ZKT5_9HYPO|nr:hypothetical protein HIM_05084 [Hirsutella minnesotensis 3608]
MHKHKHKLKAHPWGPWSEWAMDESCGRWFRVRQDGNGKLDYDWDIHQTPREIQDLTDDFRALSPGSSHDAQGEEYTVSRGPKDKSKSTKSRAKGKHRAPESNEDTQSPYSSVTAEPENKYSGYGDSLYGYEEPASDYYGQPSRDAQIATTFSLSESFYAIAGHDKGRNSIMEDLHAVANQAMYYDDVRNGESSTHAYDAYYPEDEGPPTPKACITADEEALDELDPRYKVEHSTRFQPGEIFKVHWSEPQGSGNEHAPSVSGRQEIQNRFGTKFFVGFRRFIVIANDQGHSTCVPILTYGGKGCKKKGVKPQKHGIIHERNHKARLLDGEPKLGFPPVAVEMTEEGEKLSRESRVNYSKLVTVEHNVKVFFIGSVVSKDWDAVRDAVNQCWTDKIHHKKRSR